MRNPIAIRTGAYLLAAIFSAGSAEALGTRVICDDAEQEPIEGPVTPVPGGTRSEIDYSVPGIPPPVRVQVEAEALPFSSDRRGMLYDSPTLAGFTVSPGALCGGFADTGLSLRATIDVSGLAQARLSLGGSMSMDVGPGSSPSQGIGLTANFLIDDEIQGGMAITSLTPGLGLGFSGWNPTVIDTSTPDRMSYAVEGTFEFTFPLSAGIPTSVGYQVSTQAGVFGGDGSPVTAEIESDFRDGIRFELLPIDPEATITISAPETRGTALLALALLFAIARLRKGLPFRPGV